MAVGDEGLYIVEKVVVGIQRHEPMAVEPSDTAAVSAGKYASLTVDGQRSDVVRWQGHVFMRIMTGIVIPFVFLFEKDL